MSQADADHVLILTAASAVLGSLDRQGRCTSHRRVPIPVADDDWAGVRTALAELMQGLPRPASNAEASTLTMLVSHHWLSVGAVRWSPALLRTTAADAYLRDELAASGWPVADDDVVRSEDGRVGDDRWAVAYPAPLLELLAGFARHGACRSAGVLPLAICATGILGEVGRRQRRTAWAVIEEGAATLLVRPPHGAAMVDTVVGDAAVDRLAQQWRRRAWLEPMAMGEGAATRALGLICLHADRSGAAAASFGIVPDPVPSPAGAPADMPAEVALAWTARAAVGGTLDALGPASPLRGRWTAAAAALALALGMGTLLAAHDSWSRLAQAQGRVQEASPARSVDRGGDAGVQRAGPALDGPTRQAIAQLNAPTLATLAELRPPRDVNVQLLAVDLDATKLGERDEPSITVQGRAASGIDMQTYADFVASRRHLSSVMLVKSELVGATTPDSHHRFELRASWKQ